MKPFTRVFDILQWQLEHFSKEDALAYKVHGTWKKYSTEEYNRIAQSMSLGFLAMGVQPQDKVAIISANRPEWNFVDMGLQQIGAVGVPIYPNLNAEDYHFIMRDAEVKMVFVSNLELYEKIKSAVPEESIGNVFSFDTILGLPSWQVIEEKGNTEKFIPEKIAYLAQVKADIEPHDLLTLIYTSGTTGVPKGVMLTHNNFVSNIHACIPLLPVGSEHRALSFLPLCHVYERMLNYLYLSVGISVYYAESMETIGDNLKEVNPHIFVTVPRLLEKVYDKIVAKGAELHGIKRALFFWALELGRKYELDTHLGWWYRFQLKIANKLIFNKWREALGGEVVVVVSGGAALQPRLAKIFSAAQITILEGYGLTETSPVIAVNRMDEAHRRIGTVGPIIDGVEVKIAEDGEILSRGPHIMIGYYKRPDLTVQAIDADGWFHTGDIGEMVDGLFLKITDRKKEIFKTSGGKYIAPGAMENKFKESKFIEQMIVVGDGQKFPAALIVPSFPFLKDWCTLKEIAFTSQEQLVTIPEVIDRIQKEVDEFNQGYAQYERIKKIVLLPQEWSILSGELTPTLKVKRKVIQQKYQHQIDQIYAC